MKYLYVLLLSSSLYGVTTVPYVYYSALKEACDAYDVPIKYMARLIEWESGWNPYAHNKNPNGTRDMGIAQLNSASIRDLSRWHNKGVEIDPWNWEVSLRVAVAHMRFLYDRTGSWWSAVAAYNMGLHGYNEFIAGRRRLPPGTKKELDFVFR